MYHAGQGIPKNTHRGILLFQYLQNKCSFRAMIEKLKFDELFSVAADAPKSFEQAISYYKNAAVKDNSLALNIMGFCHQFGMGVVCDLTKAVNCYMAAVKAGDSRCLWDIWLLLCTHPEKMQLNKFLQLCKDTLQTEKNPEILSFIYFILGSIQEQNLNQDFNLFETAINFHQGFQLNPKDPTLKRKQEAFIPFWSLVQRLASDNPQLNVGSPRTLNDLIAQYAFDPSVTLSTTELNAGQKQLETEFKDRKDTKEFTDRASQLSLTTTMSTTQLAQNAAELKHLQEDADAAITSITLDTAYKMNISLYNSIIKLTDGNNSNHHASAKQLYKSTVAEFKKAIEAAYLLKNFLLKGDPSPTERKQAIEWISIIKNAQNANEQTFKALLAIQKLQPTGQPIPQEILDKGMGRISATSQQPSQNASITSTAKKPAAR